MLFLKLEPQTQYIIEKYISDFEKCCASLFDRSLEYLENQMK